MSDYFASEYQKIRAGLTAGPNWLQHEASILYRTVMRCAPIDVVELGVHAGDSTKVILAALHKLGGGHLYSVDQDISRVDPAIEENLDGVGWTLICADTSAPAPRQYNADMAFVDTLHTEEQVWRELTVHLKNESRLHTIAFHDTQLFGWAGERKQRGILPAILRFMAEASRKWRVAEYSTQGNGILVLERS